MGSLVLEHAIKVRKPYTITKQRERWTEEEHDKFLEALRLHGRAWRQIEDHIGSKTAVQIRSHAQKFFTKAVRESNDVEIPPPRPKKRPMRPYPRKLGNLPSNAVVEKFPDSEQDNQSPTSVLSSTSDRMNSSASPVSSIAGSDLVGNLWCEQENGYHSATMPVDDEDESMPQHSSDMGLDLGMDDSISSKIAPSASLKLFGKMVVIGGTQKPSSINTENTEQSIAESVSTPQRGESGSQWSPWASIMAPMCYFLGHSAEPGTVPVPWFWAVSRECSNNGSAHKESETSAFRSLKTKDTKGFVTYKR